MNNYIVTSFGFIKSIIFNKETLKHEIEYTDKLRYAQLYKTKSAKSVMSKHDIVGFLYNPYAEEPIRNMYEVKQIKKNWFDDNSVNVWEPVKAIMIHENDVNFLLSRKLKKEDLLSYEDARKKAMELNITILKEVHEKVNEQNFNLHMMKVKNSIVELNND